MLSSFQPIFSLSADGNNWEMSWCMWTSCCKINNLRKRQIERLLRQSIASTSYYVRKPPQMLTQKHLIFIRNLLCINVLVFKHNSPLMLDKETYQWTEISINADKRSVGAKLKLDRKYICSHPHLYKLLTSVMAPKGK